MPIERVDGFYFHPTSRERVLAQRHADPSRTPWTPLGKPLAQCKVSLISTAGIFMKGDVSFDYDRERREGTWGDPTHREIPRTAGQDDVAYSHLHVDTSFLAEDRNVSWPVDIFTGFRERGENRRAGRDALFHHGLHPELQPAREAHSTPDDREDEGGRVWTRLFSTRSDRSATGPADCCSAKSKRRESPPSSSRTCPRPPSASAFPGRFSSSTPSGGNWASWAITMASAGFARTWPRCSKKRMRPTPTGTCPMSGPNRPRPPSGSRTCLLPSSPSGRPKAGGHNLLDDYKDEERAAYSDAER